MGFDRLSANVSELHSAKCLSSTPVILVVVQTPAYRRATRSLFVLRLRKYFIKKRQYDVPCKITCSSRNMPVPRGIGVPVIMLSLTPHTSSHRLRMRENAQNASAQLLSNKKGIPVSGAIEKDVHCLFERGQHQHTFFEFGNTESSDAQNLLKIREDAVNTYMFKSTQTSPLKHIRSASSIMCRGSILRPNESPIVY
jgi:hypothetical protein